MYDILRKEILPELIPSDSKIMVAISGGPDSVALGHVIWRYAQDNQDQNIVLVISHVNHGMRPEAGEEELLVKSLALTWGVDFLVHHFNAKEYARQTGKGFQEAAREWRYARWQEDMNKHNCTLLATAHHLGDQAETLLYRLIRGTGTAGLAGIYPRSKGVIRPLLTISKDQIINYCMTEKLSYAVDKSNLETKYDRNRIRLQLIPLLEKYNAKVQESLGRTAEVLRWDEEYIKSQVNQLWYSYCTHSTAENVLLSHGIWQLPEAILSRFFRRAVSEITAEDRGIEFRFIKTIMCEGKRVGWAQDLPGLSVKSTKDGLYFYRGELSQFIAYNDCCHDKVRFLAVSPETEFQLDIGVWYNVAPCYKVGLFDTLPEAEQILCYEKIGLDHEDGSLICRTRKEGDRLYKKGVGHKSLKKVFQDHKIPARYRNTIPLIANADHVIWIPGILRSDRLLPGEHTKHYYCVFALK